MIKKIWKHNILLWKLWKVVKVLLSSSLERTNKSPPPPQQKFTMQILKSGPNNQKYFLPLKKVDGFNLKVHKLIKAWSMYLFRLFTRKQQENSIYKLRRDSQMNRPSHHQLSYEITISPFASNIWIVQRIIQ